MFLISWPFEPQVAALSVALFRALNFTTRYDFIMKLGSYFYLASLLFICTQFSEMIKRKRN